MVHRQPATADDIESDERRARVSKYEPGQHVTLVDRRDVEAAWSGGYTVAAVIASADGVLPPRYHIQSMGGAYGRWAEEGQLSRTFTIQQGADCGGRPADHPACPDRSCKDPS